MGNIDGPSNLEFREIVRAHLTKLGVNHDLINIEVKKGPTVILKGEVYSDNVRNMIKEAINEMTEVYAVVDELIVTRELYDDMDDADENGLMDEDKDLIGTEDVSRSIEDGIPYIPPTSPSYREHLDTNKPKRRKKKP